MNKYGFKDTEWEIIQQILKNAENVEKAVLFGSRAMNTFKPMSDVDIVVYGDNIKHSDIVKLETAFEDSDLPQMFDIVRFKSIKSEELIKHIEKYGVIVFERGYSEEWEYYKLSDLMEIIGGGTPRTSVQSYWNGNIPWLSVVDFNNDDRYVSNTEKTITEEGLINSSTKLLEKGDLIISARGTVGELAQLTKPMAFNQSCYGLRAKEGIGNDFLYYLVKFSLRKLLRNTHGGVFDTITRNTFELIENRIPKSDIERKEIVKTLTSLDDKIALLRQQNQTLEELAQTLFKRWFVDFEFPNEKGEPYKSSGGKMIESELGEIPEGWRVGEIYDLLDVRYGYPFKSKLFNEDKLGTPLIRIRDLKRGYTGFHTEEEYSDDYIVACGEIVAGMDAEFKPYIWSGDNGLLNQRVCKFIGKQYVSEIFIYEFMKPYLYFFEKTKVGTTVCHLGKGDLDSIEALIPELGVIKRFTELVSPMHSSLVNNYNEIRDITCIRDSLLPKLMSGELI